MPLTQGCLRAATAVIATALAVLLTTSPPLPVTGAGAGAGAPAGDPLGQTASPHPVVSPTARYVLPLGTAPPAPFERSSLVASGLLVADFDPPAAPWLAGHRGVDLAGPEGSPVVAPAAGVVTFAGVVVDRPVLVVTHAGGLRSTLEPVEATLAVGATVGRGEAVGLLGAAALSHCAPAACVHWGVLRGEVYLDPLVLVGVAEPVVLLPLTTGALATTGHLTQTQHGEGAGLEDAGLEGAGLEEVARLSTSVRREGARACRTT